jgi:WS/DGAT/MGAT family acyltransferase
MVNLATDSATAPMQVGAVLLFESDAGFDVGSAKRALAERLSTIPRMRQRLQGAPFACGRPFWIDDDRFDPADRIQIENCPEPGDRDAVLARAARLIERRLDPSRPLWSATFIRGMARDQNALIVLFHHVMSDGIGGLAMLTRLVDGVEAVGPPAGVSQAPPGTLALLVDAWRERVGSFLDWRGLQRRVRGTFAAIGPARRNPAPLTSLNRPIGTRRRFEVVQADLGAVHAVARSHGATVNDLVLTVVAFSLRELLLGRGESLDHIVASVPVSRRTAATTHALGNDVGVAPMVVSTVGDVWDCLEATAAMSRQLKAIPKDGDLFAPFARVLGRMHLIKPFLDRQHMINTLVTNVRGPGERLSFLGTPISDAIPLSVVTGNITVAFAVLSYAGTLTITLVADPETCPELPVLREAIARHLMEVSAVVGG